MLAYKHSCLVYKISVLNLPVPLLKSIVQNSSTCSIILSPETTRNKKVKTMKTKENTTMPELIHKAIDLMKSLEQQKHSAIARLPIHKTESILHAIKGQGC